MSGPSQRGPQPPEPVAARGRPRRAAPTPTATSRGTWQAAPPPTTNAEGNGPTAPRGPQPPEPDAPRGRPRRAAPTRLVALAALTALIAACDDSPPPGQLRFAIAAETCEAYCLTAIRVTLYEEGDDLPLGPPLQASCASADALVFTTLPAGLRVEAVVDAFDLTGDTLMTGRSAAVTIAASRQTDLVIPLTATTQPTITSAEPDPIAPSLAPTLTVFGDQLGPLGDHGLLLDEQPLTATFTPSTDDGPDQISATLTDQTGASLVARRCGVASEPYPLRVVADTPGAASVNGLPLCGGAPVAVAQGAPFTVIAWRCESASNSQLALMTGGSTGTGTTSGAVCPLDPAGAWPLGAAPTGPLALSSGTTPAAWVALPDQVARVDLATGATTTLPVVVTALAVTSTHTWAIADHLVELHDDGTTTPRPELFPELDFIALSSAASSNEPTQPLWVAATTTTATPQGRLVSIPNTATPTAYPLPCAPTALVASEHTVALACPDTLVLWDVATSTSSSLALAAHALAIPSDAPDTVFALTADGLTHVDLAPSPTVLVTTPLAADTLVSLGSRRLLVHAADSNTLRVLTPYDAKGPCP